ncbi:MAG: T9SS type A sorting domain-containing protein [Chitinophagaceae bacterium]|nr:T9SS type A sorting domain-containing protein [Chitinophagaceae bacterium]
MRPRTNPTRGAVLILLLLTGIQQTGLSQNCRELTATYTVAESRCMATGSVKVTPSGGSGTYNYKMQGPTVVDYTSSNLITGLQPGTYTLTVKDVVTNCETTITNVVIPGSYTQPRFGLTETDVTCNNGSDGVISVTGILNGRTPFVYKLVAPSPMGVGTTNSTGTFTGLMPGTYSVQMTDSCGSIQTRTISIQNYTWSITAATVTLSNCQTYNVQISLKDSKGNTNASGTAFNGWKYGVVRSAGDTIWSNSQNFNFNLGNNRTIVLIAKDKCGQIQSKTWANKVIPSIDAAVTISGQTCTVFNATVTGQVNMNNAQYCIVDASGNAISGQPCNPTGVFNGLPYGSYCIKAKQTCYDTVISRCFTQTRTIPAVDATASLSGYTCTTFTATVTGKSNLTNPQYCITDAAGRPVPGQSCNPSGVFNDLPYGTYKITVTDGCQATPLTVTVNGIKRTRTVGNIVTNNYGCSTFTAILGGASNLIKPKYCLVDAAGNEVTCNSTGIFTNIPYGNYCINVTDTCRDTTIQRCVTVTKPVPTGGSPNISNLGCNGYTITVTGQKNIFNGQYCLLDANGNTIECNTSGVFNNVPYGKVCVKTTDGCTNGVFTNCITTTAPVPSIGPAAVVNLSCSTFKATITNQQNLSSPQFCLYDQQGNQVGVCNGTGIFTITGYGAYTIKTTDGCTGKVFTTPFNAPKPTASVNANLSYSNQTCSSFTVTVTGQQNLAGAQYTLKDNAGTVVATNPNGVFNNVSYGSYCIDIVNACRDTTITRCFSQQPIAVDASATASPSCTYDATDLAIKVTAGTGPYQVKVYDTLYNLVTSASISGTTTTVKGIPSLSTALKYKVVVLGVCGKPDTVTVAAQPSNVLPIYSVTPQCPSSLKADGSGTLAVTATSNLSGLNVSITQQDFSPVSISYSFKSGNTFTFPNLDAGTYVLTYTFSGCTTAVNDTTVVPKYVFPSLAKSSAYQCDNNSFSVGALVTGGIAPYTYEIIASSPATPSVVTSPQSSPIFSLNNNVKYNLIRLRAVDACGNSALNDVSILPLANTIVTATSDCLNRATTLSTDALPNATFTWYKKSKTGDSVLLASGSPTYSISNVKFSDTGLYVAKTSVNSGCLTKISYFRLTGTCGTILPVNITLEGSQLSGGNRLSWTVPVASGIGSFELQRTNDASAVFIPVANIPARASVQQDEAYAFVDNHPGPGSNLYRLHVLYNGGGESYTNVVELGGGGGGPQVSAYPNPVDRTLNIKIQGDASQLYTVALYNVIGQAIFTRQVNGAAGVIQYHRNAAVAPGLYILKIFNTTVGTYNTYKIQFK